MCVPKSPKDAVGNSQRYGDKDLRPGNGPGYNTWGASGYSDTGYAWEEKPTQNDMAEMTHDYAKYDQEDKEFAKKDARMKFGKFGKKPSLKPGEVRMFNKETGKYESNK